MVDERWLNRITRGELFVDIITNMPTVTTHVTDDWFEDAPETELFGAKVKGQAPPTHLIWVEYLRRRPSPLRRGPTSLT